MGPDRPLEAARRLHSRRQCTGHEERATCRRSVRAMESQSTAHSRHNDEQRRRRRLGPQVEEAAHELQRQKHQRPMPCDGVASRQRNANGDRIAERRTTRHSVLGSAQHIRTSTLSRITHARRHVALVVLCRPNALALVWHRWYSLTSFLPFKLSYFISVFFFRLGRTLCWYYRLFFVCFVVSFEICFKKEC